MQAVILAGGQGKRLHSLTKDIIPKPMVPVVGVPLLERQIQCLVREGISKVLLVVGHLGTVIKQNFGDGRRFNVKIDYFEEKEPLGTGGALPLIKDQLDEEFFLLFGDLLFDVSLDRMIRFHHEKSSFLTMMVHPNTHPYDSDLVLVDEESRITKIDLKNPNRCYWFENLVNAGLYVMNKEVCSYVPNLKGEKVDLEKNVIAEIIKQRADVFAYRSSEYLRDVGTVERIRESELDLIGGKVANRNLHNKQKAIFLDRDGTINRSCGYIDSPKKFFLEDGVVEAIKNVNNSGYLAIVVTNQPAVARGLITIDGVMEINRKMETLLGNEGAFLDKIYFCPHHPDVGYPGENKKYKIPCDCRKPSIGMILQAQQEFNLDLSKCWMVGDTTTDIKTAENGGMRSVLVLTGEKGEDKKYSCRPNFVAPNLKSAINLILGDKYER